MSQKTIREDCWTRTKVRKNCEKCLDQPQCKEEVTAYAKSLGITNFEWTPPNLSKSERMENARKRLELQADRGAGE